MRKSSYIINIKLENENDKHLLVHGYTGAIDIVNENISKYFQDSSEVSPNSLPFSQETFSKLYKRGYFTDKSEEEERKYVRKTAHLLHNIQKLLSNSYVFLITYDCNFRCSYCYEKGISQNSRFSNKIISKELVDYAYQAIQIIQTEKRLKPKNITLYGGEPLMATNRNIIEYIVRKGKDLNYSFFAVTNGYELENYEDLLGNGMIDAVQITIDGLEETHNCRRVHFNKKPTFSKIVENIGIALDKGVNVFLRINTDDKNFNDLESLILKFKDLGFFDKKGKLKPYSAPLFNYEQKNNNDFKFLKQKEFNEKHATSGYKYSCDITNKASQIKEAIISKKRLNLSPIYCSAQSGSYIFDPIGDIYSCWNQVGNKNKIIGKYDKDGVTWTDYKEIWHKFNIGISEQCSKCKYSFLCKGGCMSQNELLNGGKLQTGFCNSFANTFSHIMNCVYNELKNNQSIL